MLLYPSINTLNEKTDSRYSLCILAAKRARDIVDGKPALTEEECERPVSQAAIEVAEDMISYKRPVYAAPDSVAAEIAAAISESEEAAEAASDESAETAEPAADETSEAAAEVAEEPAAE